MKALGWVATMRSGQDLPFPIKPPGLRAGEVMDILSNVGVRYATPGYVRTPLFRVLGTVERPTLQGGRVTKLVLRACPPSR